MTKAAQAFDLVVVGSGPGGYIAAIRAAQLGMTTAVVECDQLGGICLNWGCIPTKALLRSVDLYRSLQHAESFGLAIDGKLTFDPQRIVARSREVAARLSRGVAHLMKKNRITVLQGHGALAGRTADGSRRVALVTAHGTTEHIIARRVILAAGARARALPHLQPDGKLVWTYKEAMVPDALPKSVLIVGSGAIGVEFASFYRALGVEVTVAELLDRILPAEDEEISALAHKSFQKQGMKLLAANEVTALEKGSGSVTATLRGKTGEEQRISVERVILALGIVGNVEGIGLEGTGVKVEKSHVVVDGYGFTGEPGVYAIGDLVGPPWLAHKASHEAVTCVERIAGHPGAQPLDASKIPNCTYCTPQIASVGLTEAAARSKGHAVKIGRCSFLANGKAIALGEPEGLVKTVFEAQTGELLGAHMIGAEVTELIQGFVIARTLEATEADLMHTVFPHPTLSEAMHESVLDAFGSALNL
jgi:dihydrolipoamide dehydrogenase